MLSYCLRFQSLARGISRRRLALVVFLLLPLSLEAGRTPVTPSAANPQTAGNGVPSSVLAPTGLTGSIDNSGNMNLTWTPVSGASSYSLDRETVSTGTWQIGFATTSSPSYQDPWPSYNSGGFGYRVSAVGQGITSSPSAVYPAPRYAVIDLGPNIAPEKITNSGYVLYLKYGAGPFWGVWFKGSVITLSAQTTGDEVVPSDISETGTVVGREIVSPTDVWELAVWAPGVPTPTLTPGPTITNQMALALFGLSSNSGVAIDAENNIWSQESNSTGAGDGFKNNVELGTAAYDSNGNPTGIEIDPIATNNQGDLVSSVSLWPSIYNQFYSMNNIPLSFVPSGISNEIGGKVFMVGQSSDNSSLPLCFWDGRTQTTQSFGAIGGGGTYTSINAKTVTLNGQTVPAIQMVNDGQLWEMDPATGVFKSPGCLIAFTSPNSGWNSIGAAAASMYSSHALNDSGAIVGAATKTSDGTLHGVLLVPAELDVDYNRDGKIEPSTVSGSADAGKVTTDNPWRFWINDSDENGDIAGNDVPGSGNNYAFQVVRGMRDLINFFPAYLDIKGLLQVLPAESNTYKIKQADGAINFVLTDLTPDKAGQFLKQSPMLLNPSGNLDNPIILSNGSKVHVTSDGATLPTDWLNKVKNQNEGVILIDGYAQTTQPLVLEVTNNSTGQVLAQLKLPLKIDSIEKMYRVRNLRNDAFVGTPADQGAPDNTGEPSNYPDKLTNGKNVIFLHGYNVSGTASRGWSAEMFKRFFWSGSKAKFHSITWFGDPYTTGSAVPQYHDAVIDAFAASADVATYVNGLSGQKTIIAHSLGNMVVSSAIKDHGMTVDQYFLVDAAVAEEAYDSSYTVDYEGMGHPDWMDSSFNPTYSTTLWASEWHDLFSSGDGRKGLTWRDRFAGVTGYNFYSSSENVLARYTGDPGLSAVVNIALTGGQNAWTLQERLKGRRVDLVVAAIGSLYGGWQFNLTDPADPSDPIYYENNPPHSFNRYPLAPASLSISNTLAQRLPLFDPGFGDNFGQERTGNTATTRGPSWIRDLYGSSGSATASTYTKRATLLAQDFPALTPATGANPQDIFSSAGTDQRNFDEIGFATSPVGIWPRSDNSWFHSDIKDVGYPYLYKIFDRYVTIGNLNQ